MWNRRGETGNRRPGVGKSGGWQAAGAAAVAMAAMHGSCREAMRDGEGWMWRRKSRNGVVGVGCEGSNVATIVCWQGEVLGGSYLA